MTRLEAAIPEQRETADLLAVEGLDVKFATASGWLPVVDDVGFRLSRGETLGLVGESGSGKTVSALAVLGLLPRRSSSVTTTTLRFDGRDLSGLPAEEMRKLRGDEISMIFQEPMTSLNPAFTVGNQIIETVRAHRKVSRSQARKRAIEMLDLVGIPDPNRRIDDHPHAFSGGMRQRAMIAMALANNPKLLIADEPTTALDVTIQAQVLDLMRTLQKEFGMGILFVTHDLGVVAEICDRVTVLYAGEVVEHGSVEEIFSHPHHPYTEGLLASMPQTTAPGDELKVIPGQVPRPDQYSPGCRFHPRCSYGTMACTGSAPQLVSIGTSRSRCIRIGEIALVGSVWTEKLGSALHASTPAPQAPPLLEVRGLSKEFPVHSGLLKRVIGHVSAVVGVDLAIPAGQTLGLVGESGSGKSTAARLILRLIEPTSGSVLLDGEDIMAMPEQQLRRARKDMQIVFQDPYSSLDPRATIAATIGEPLEVHLGIRGRERDERVAELLALVGLGRHLVRRYPHEFSGGQRQRIAIARALALNPRLLICDEPVSSLDVSTQSQVINLLAKLQSDLGLTCLFIAHDLSVVRHISDQIAVMYLGRIVEVGAAEQVYTSPTHPYTAALLSAIPVPDPVVQRTRRRIVLQGDIPSPLNPPSGCRFHTRCPYAMEVCAHEDPPPFTTSTGTTVFCHLHLHGPRLDGAPVSLLTKREGGGA